MSIALNYPKSSPMLAKYLELNRARGFQVWREGRKDNRVAMVSEPGIGFPEDFRGTVSDARQLARQLADHCGLPVFEDM
jgi:hypothetical protein